MSPKAKSAPIEELEPEAAKPASRISIPLTDSGTIDFETMRPATRERLNDAIKASGMGSQASSVSGEPAATPEAEKWPRETIPAIYDALTTAIGSVGKIFFKWPKDFAYLIQFNDEEKEKLTEPTGQMIDKYGPANMRKYATEIQFAMVLSSACQSMVQRAVGVYSEQLKNAAAIPGEATRVNGHAVNATSEAQNIPIA